MKVKKPLVRHIFIAFITVILVLGISYLRIPDITRYVNFNFSAATLEIKTKIEFYKLYNGCGHLIKQREYETLLNELDKMELHTRYPAEAGWDINYKGNTVKLVQRVEGFCPIDKEIRHLGVKEGFLTIFIGPAYLDGPIKKITNIRIDSLPVELQQKIYNRSLEFSSEAELLEALDSLDEYQ